MAVIFNQDLELKYPSTALQSAVAINTNTWSASDELQTALTAPLQAESLTMINCAFKSGNYWYWFQYGDAPTTTDPRPLKWMRSATKPNIVAGTTAVQYSQLSQSIKDRWAETSGVLVWYRGDYVGTAKTLAAASDLLSSKPHTSDPNDCLFKVFGTISTPTDAQYMARSGTIDLTAGSVVEAKELPVFFGFENNPARYMRIIGEGTLKAPITNYQMINGITCDIRVKRWEGYFTSTVQASNVKGVFTVKGVHQIVPATKDVLSIGYKYNGFYETPFNITYENCLVEFTTNFLYPHGTSPDLSGASANEVNSNDVKLFNNTFIAPNTAQILKLDSGSINIQHVHNRYIGVSPITQPNVGPITIDNSGSSSGTPTASTDLSFSFPIDKPSSVHMVILPGDVKTYSTNTLKNASGASYKLNGVVKTLPFTPVAGDDLQVSLTITDATKGAYLILT